MRKSVLATLVYYDILDFPLKAEEVLKCLAKTDGDLPPSGPDLLEVKRAVDQLVLEKIIDRDGPYYYLWGRDFLVPLRLKREKISRRKWRQALKAIRRLKFIPYVETVFASGSLALSSCDELSDLDVLVVTKHGRIWLTRFLITVWLSWLGVRRKPEQKIAPDKICLNHYITDKSLRIPFESIYNAQNYVNLRPVLVRDWKVIEKFKEENNWINKFVIGDWAINNDPKKLVKIGWLARLISGISAIALNTKLGDWLEKVARRYQTKRIEANPLTKDPNGHVVYNDEQLAFHPDSPEQLVIEEYHKRLIKLLGP
ncbi:MAG: hypothetical protein HY454_01455 [Parcubacteria group bacterium]|nr:hypothetical protein [Parcubacteria group bacterium]